MTRKPPRTATTERLVNQRLQYLYLRRNVVDQLIRTLEDYERMATNQQAPVNDFPAVKQAYLREMAS